MKKGILCLFVLIAASVFSQEASQENQLKKVDELTRTKLIPLVKELYAAKTDEAQKKANTQLLAQFEEAIKIPETFSYTFDSLKKDIGVLVSPDGKFRIIHWNIAKKDGTFEYFGFLQSKHLEIKKEGVFRKTKNETIQLYPLIDKSPEIKKPDNTITDNNKWYGALYYKIIVKKTKARTYYTLLGWDGNDKFTQKKIIEVLTFDAAGKPIFGADIFNYEKKHPKRVIFEYSATCNMSLKYSNRKDSIIFGHLAPTEPQLEGQFQYYCNDMSFDGFGFKKGKWNYGADVNATNEKDERDKLYHDPKNKADGRNQSNTYINPNKKKRKSK